MSSRTRGKRAPPATAVEPEPIAESSTSRSRGRASRGKAKMEHEFEEGHEEPGIGGGLALGESDDGDGEQVEEDAEEEEDDDAEDDFVAPRARGRGRGRGGRARGRGGARGRGRGGAGRRSSGRAIVEDDDDDDVVVAGAGVGDTDAEGEQGEQGEDDMIVVKPSRRTRKSVSYKEIPPQVPEPGDDDEEEEEEDEDEDEEGELDEDDQEAHPRKRQPPVRLNSQMSLSTPRRRPRQSLKADAGSDEDKNDTPYKKEKIPGGSGRGGFSVKGAAAAAARARWDKVRREKIERGEDPDEPRSARKPKRRPVVPDAPQVEMDSTYTIKGQEYTVGDDELVLPDDPKGETKVDAEGRLQGGREYKLVTFTSENRRNPNRLYAMTIDAARACGYTDSLAFLRRCPQILKLSCSPEERQLLMDIGRIAGNLKHRQVTMVAVRNVYKLMGAKVVKGGKWVTDDYYEDEALEKCKQLGYEPYTIVEEEDVNANATAAASGPSRNQQQYDVTRSHVNLTPFYTVGGPTTTFAGNGSDPWSEIGGGHRRRQLRAAGVTEEDWMARLADESRVVDGRLKGYRAERITALQGVDAVRGWVYAAEQKTDEEEPAIVANGNTESGPGPVEEEDKASALAPALDRKRSALSHDVTREVTQLSEDEPITPLPEIDGVDQAPNGDGDGEMGMDDAVPQRRAPEIIVQQPGEVGSGWHWGLGTWRAGTIKAAYEPHTQMPHVPLHTQPSISTSQRTSYAPIITSLSDPQGNLVQSTLQGPQARGLASVEYVFERAVPLPLAAEVDGGFGGVEESLKRMREVEDAVRWEREMRKRRREAM